MGDYLRAIELEMDQQESPAEIDTLYFGGGTPSQLPAEAFDKLCDLALAWRPLATLGEEQSQYEWTVEANPADITPDWIAQIASRGVTRLSLGGQSFSAAKLTRLERDHTPDDIHRAVDLARDAGIDACLDLIFAAPEETIADWRADLSQAIALKPEHLSTYGLTYEQGTSFWNRRARGELTEAEDELQREMYVLAMDELSSAGWRHYEVSNFAQPGHESRHNRAYWSGQGYFAVGPGASRYVDGVRETNHRSTTTYLRRVLAGESPVAEREQLTPEQRARETLVFGLRQLDGVSRAAFEEQSGFSIDQLAGPEIGRFVEQELLCLVGDRLRLTREGLLVSDALWPSLL